jgi:hypothetical protein
MTDTLRELWDQIDAGLPPVGDVSREGDRVRRRRRLGMVVGAAVTVAAVAGATAVVTGANDRSEPAPSVSTPGWVLDPPAGMRWAGIGRVVVAIPRDWSTDGPSCADAPSVNSIYLGTNGGPDCLATPESVMSVALFPAGSDEAVELIDESRKPSFSFTSATVDGVEVLTSPGVCATSMPGSCIQAIVVPTLGIAMRLGSTGEDFSAIAKSVRILPEGWTTVPFTLDAADPVPGTPIEVGVTAEVVEPVVRPVDLPTNEWEPGDQGLLAKLSGVLTFGDDGCVRLGEGPGAFVVVWPKGFRAETRGGALVVVDADGREYVEGTRLTMGGGFVPNRSSEGACLPPRGAEVASIQSEVEVTGE